MDEYLSEKEQVEQIREWLRENGLVLLAGVALGGLLLFGWRQYQAYRVRQAEQAATLYQSVQDATEGDKPTDAESALQKLRADFPTSAYTDQAGLLIARTLVISAPDRAANELRYVMEHSKESELAMIARLRLARVLAYRQQYDAALGLLAVPDQGKFAGRFNEVKGDIQAGLGHVDEARNAYLAAMVADGSELLDRNLLQMKLNDLPPAAPDSGKSGAGETEPGPKGSGAGAPDGPAGEGA